MNNQGQIKIFKCGLEAFGLFGDTNHWIVIPAEALIICAGNKGSWTSQVASLLCTSVFLPVK